MAMTTRKLYETVNQHYHNRLPEAEFLGLLNSAVNEFNKRTKANIKTITGDSSGTSDEQALVTTSETYEYDLPTDTVTAIHVEVDGESADNAWEIRQDQNGKYLHFDLYQQSGLNIMVEYIAEKTEITSIDSTELPFSAYWDYYKYYLLSDLYVGDDNKRSAAFNAKKKRRLKEALRYYYRRTGMGGQRIEPDEI